MKTCKHCAFWGKLETGCCGAADYVYEQDEGDLGYDPNYIEEEKDKTQLTIAVSYYSNALLRTGPDFGCVKFQPQD